MSNVIVSLTRASKFISVLLELGRETDRGLNCKLSFLASSSWVTSVCTPISQRIAPKLLAILRPTYTNCRFNITQIKLSKWLSDSSSTPILNFCLAFLSGRSLSWSTLRTSVHPPPANLILHHSHMFLWGEHRRFN